MMRRIPAAIRLASLSLATSLSLPVLADIDLVGSPTLSSSSDVSLTDDAYLSGLSVTQRSLDGSNFMLLGDGSIGQSGMLNGVHLTFGNGNLQMESAGKLYFNSIWISSNLSELSGGSYGGPGFETVAEYWQSGNSGINATGVDTAINTNAMTLHSGDGYQAQISLSNGASATINNTLDIEGIDSAININNATLTAGFLENQGTINVSGMASSLQITAMNNGYFGQQLGKINFSQGAQFNQFQLSLRNGDLVTATDAVTQINATMTHIEDTILQINNGARLNSTDIWLYAGSSVGQNASLNADGSGVPNNDPYDPPVSSQINTDNLYITSAGGYQASLNISNGAIATINNELKLIGTDTTVILDNASLITSNLYNEGTINVSGSNSSLHITNNGYSGEPFGKINFSNGAQFSQNDLHLRNSDQITATGSGTQINALGTWNEGTMLSLNDGARINSQNHIWVRNGSLNADGTDTQVHTDHFALKSEDGYQASLNLSNGATATINQKLYVFGTDSVVNIDNAALSTNNLLNEGTINVSGAASSLQITNNGYSGEPLGKINFSNGAQFNQNDLNLRNGDVITATGTGTQINTTHNFILGSTLKLNDGAILNSENHISATASSWYGDASIEADGTNTQINSDYFFLNSEDGFQATLNMRYGSVATINQLLHIQGNNSVVNLDNAALTTYNLHNEGTINVSGSNSSLQINNNYGEPLGKINFSNGAQLNKNYLYLEDGDLITATGENTQINSDSTWIQGTTLNLSNGATFNSQYQIEIWGGGDIYNSGLIADGENTTINTSYLHIQTSGENDPASLNISNGATANISDQLRIDGAGGTINIDNATLTTNRLHNEGTINVSGSHSSLQITNNGYSSEPLGKINFSNGAQFNQNDLFLHNGDLITATDVSTQINTWMTGIQGANLQLNNGAALNSDNIWLSADYWTGGNATLNADGAGIPADVDDALPVSTEINTNHLNLDSRYGYQATLNLSNGATANINHELRINGADSVVNLDNASLTTYFLRNEGTINASGINSSLILSSNNYYDAQIGKINLSNGAFFSQSELSLHDGDLISATGDGTQINSFATVVQDADLVLNDGAKINSFSHIFVDANSTINSNNASIETGSLHNLGKLISQGDDNITGHVDNNGIIDIEDQLTITGDLHMQSEGSLIFNFGDDPLNEFGTLVLNGYLWGDDTIDIRFDQTEYMEADHAYGYTIDLIVASSMLPGMDMFNIDMSAFNFLGEGWNRSVSVIDNRLVLSVTSAVPVPASLWLMMSAILSLTAMKRRQLRLH